MKLWGPEQTAQLERLAGEGLTVQEIAAKMGFSVTSIRRHAGNVAVRKAVQYWTEAEEAELIRRLSAGERAPQIAEAMGCTYGRVSQKIWTLTKNGKLPRANVSRCATQVLRLHDLRIGGLARELSADKSDDARNFLDWLARQIKRDGCESAAEWLVEIAKDKYFEEADK